MSEAGRIESLMQMLESGMFDLGGTVKIPSVEKKSDTEKMPEYELIIRAHMHKYNLPPELYNRILKMAYSYVGESLVKDPGTSSSYGKVDSALREFCTKSLCNLNFDEDLKDVLGEDK